MHKCEGYVERINNDLCRRNELTLSDANVSAGINFNNIQKAHGLLTRLSDQYYYEMLPFMT